MTGEVVDGFGPIFLGGGAVSTAFVSGALRRVDAGLGGEGRRGSELRCAGEKCICSRRTVAVGLGCIFLGRSEPNQAETDWVGTKGSLH